MKYPLPNLLVDSRHAHVPNEIERAEFFQLLRIIAGEDAVVRWDRDVADQVGDDVLVSVHDGGDNGHTPQRYRHRVHGLVRVYLSGSAAAWIAERDRWVFTRRGAEREGGTSANDLGDAIDEALGRSKDEE